MVIHRKNRNLWRAMIHYILKRYGLEKKINLFLFIYSELKQSNFYVDFSSWNYQMKQQERLNLNHSIVLINSLHLIKFHFCSLSPPTNHPHVTDDSFLSTWVNLCCRLVWYSINFLKFESISGRQCS